MMEGFSARTAGHRPFWNFWLWWPSHRVGAPRNPLSSDRHHS